MSLFRKYVTFGDNIVAWDTDLLLVFREDINSSLGAGVTVGRDWFVPERYLRFPPELSSEHTAAIWRQHSR